MEIVIMFVMTGFFLMIGIFSMKVYIEEKKRTKDWAFTNGIRTKMVTRSHGINDRYSTPSVEYEAFGDRYSVRGSHWTIPLLSILKRKYKVKYNPDDPGEARLSTHNLPNLFIWLGCFVIVAVLLFILIFFMI